MPQRLCPNCKSVLGDYDHFFCSACGVKLPKTQVLEMPRVRIKNYKLSSVTKAATPEILSAFKSIRTYYIFTLLIFIGFVLFGIFRTGVYEFAKYEFDKKPPIADFSEIAAKKEHKIELTEFAVKRGKFTTLRFTEILPFDTAIYFEGVDIEFLSKYLIIDQSLNDLLRNPTILLESSYVGFNYAGNWGYIFIPKDPELVRKIMEGVKSNYWSFGIVKNMFVLASNPSVLTEVAKIEGGLVSSLALNSEFVSKDQQLAEEGKIKVILAKQDNIELVKNSLGGLDQTIISHINKLITSGFDSIVVD